VRCFGVPVPPLVSVYPVCSRFSISASAAGTGIGYMGLLAELGGGDMCSAMVPCRGGWGAW
jgi:hypothetical protein